SHVSLGNETNDCGAGTDRFIDREEPVGVEKRIAVVGRYAGRRGEQAVDAGRDAADRQIVRILVADGSASESIAGGERVDVVVGVDESNRTGNCAFLADAEARGSDRAAGPFGDVSFGD